MPDQTSTIISKVWGMCGPLRDDGVSYGDYLEQLTYLIFLKMSDEYSKPPYKRETGIPAGCGWSDMNTLKGAELESKYKSILETLGEQGGTLGKIFQGAVNKISNAAILYRIVQMIDKENWVSMSTDVKGEIYEGLLQKNAEDVKSGAGQYFTPRPLIRAMVWNHEAEMEEGLFRVSIPDFDKRAFREALVNAFCHRDYSMLGRVRVEINSEGMLISNPGGFIEGINADNLLDAEPHGRNPVLADALKRIGLAERTGRGIDRIYEGSLLYGRLLPDYSRSTSTSVRLFIPRGMPDRAFVRMISEEQQRLGHPLPIYALLVLNTVKQMHQATLREISEALKRDESRIKIVVETLVESGLVEAIGNGRGRNYMLSPKAYGRENTAAYIRQKGIDELRYEELVLELARKQKSIKRADVIALLHVSPAKAFRILQRLVKNQKLTLQGKGAGAYYTLEA